MILDFHAHAFPDALAPKAVPRLCKASGFTPHHDGTVAGLRASMRQVGVDKSIVMPIATKSEQVRSINDWVLSFASGGQPGEPNGKLLFFGTIHPLYEDYRTEFRRLKAAGIRGIKLHPNYQEFCPDDPSLLPLFESCASEGLILMIHAGHDAAFVDAPGSPDRLARLAQAVPELKIVCAHFGGWRLWDDVDRLLVGRPNIYLDTSFTIDYLEVGRIVEMSRRHGLSRILFGTDTPWRDAGHDIEQLRASGFRPDELECIFWNNGMKLLNGQ